MAWMWGFPEVDFAVRAGQIVGIGGVAGNGQDTLLAVLSGEVKPSAGEILFDGQEISALGPAERRDLGLLTAPEERLGHAAAPDMSLSENALLSGWSRLGLTKSGFINWGATDALAEDVIARFDVRTPSPYTAARALSGGNLQKFVMGREIAQRPRLLVANQPTWGVDAAAAATIRQALLDLASEGAGVLVISQDLDELIEIADIFAALNGGQLSAPYPMQELSLDQIGLMLGGAGPAHPLFDAPRAAGAV